MSRAATAWRLVRERRREDLARVVARALFPPWLFRSNEMLIARLTRPRPLPRPLDGITIRWGRPEDEPALQRIRPREEGYGHHFEAGHVLVVGELDGRVASFNWFETDGLHVSRANGYRFRYGPRGAWAFGFEVDPAARMSGIFHKHWVEALALLAGRGIEAVYGSIQCDNPRSVNSHRRLGFEMLYLYRVLRIAGVIHYAVHAGGPDGPLVDAGFGRWDGAVPAVAVQEPVTR